MGDAGRQNGAVKMTPEGHSGADAEEPRFKKWSHHWSVRPAVELHMKTTSR